MNKKVSSIIIGSFFALAASLSMGAVGVSAAGLTVITNGSPSVTSTTATISGMYSGSSVAGADTYFSWGPTPSLGSNTPLVHVTSTSFSATLTGLTPGTQYFYQAFASNSTDGPGYGSTLSFTTTNAGAVTPSVLTTGATSSIGGTSATLKGFYNANGAGSSDTQFLWGLSSTNLSQATGFVTQSGASGNFTANIGPLTPGTTYYYKAAAKNSGSLTAYGSLLSFTTTASTGANCTIDAFNGPSSAVTPGTSVTLSWTTVGCTSGSINNGVGAAAPIASGSVSTPVGATTIFTLTATDGTHYAYKNVTVTVTGGGTNSCVLNSFSATPSTVAAGISSTLYIDAQGCTSLSISPLVGNVTGMTSVSTGALYGTTVFTLTGTSGAGIPHQLTTTVTVVGGGTGGSCAISYFTASPATVSYGGTTLLSWGTQGCTSANLSSSGSVGLTASTYTAALYYTTTYTLTAYDAYGTSVQNSLVILVSSGTTTSGTTTWGTTTYGTTNGGGGYCVINSFYASPSTVTNGQSTNLSWSTSGCTSTTLTGGNTYTRYEPANGSDSTGILYGTTTYTLYGNGGASASQSLTVYVTNSPYPYQYTCGSGSYYDPSCSGQYAGNIITTVPTNVGSTTARLNGIANNVTNSFAAYFEYGTTPSLGQATPFQNTFATNSLNFYDTVSTLPSTTYYYRAVAQINGVIVRGNILSFTTRGASTTNIVYVGGSSNSLGYGSTTGGTSSVAPTPAGVTLTIANQQEKYNVGDTVNYTVTYTNGSNKTLTNTVLTFILPLGFTVKQTTQGIMQPPTTVTANLGTLAVGQTGTLFIQAVVQPNVDTTQTLVTNGTLAYTLPNGSHDSAVGYVLNHAQVQNVFAGFALGSGFFPSTIFGWLFTAIIILIIVLISRRIARAKHDAHGHGDPHGGHGAPAKH